MTGQTEVTAGFSKFVRRPQKNRSTKKTFSSIHLLLFFLFSNKLFFSFFFLPFCVLGEC